ncbi:MAG: hypothetical protein LBE38_00215 [Deltaproteobacteria bacterium]|jgi:hypothetical protein|nr:hypothetical protein [Deltaproteobacteria bacterium]
MTSVDARGLNTSLSAQPNSTREAWRQEMLGELLGRMRQHNKPAIKNETEVAIPKKATGKGYYVDIYV